MPELPEVQTIRNQLQTYLPIEIDKTESSRELYQNILHTKIPRKLPELLKIQSHGKLLIFHFQTDLFLLSHLGMSGSWRIAEEPCREKHTHFEFQGHNKDGPLYLSYVDPRRFGHMYFVNGTEKSEYLKRLGHDISSPKFDEGFIKLVFSKSQEREIKPLLLEQKYFAGSGNYIANEVCARAGFLPDKKCCDLPSNAPLKIKKAFQSVLDESIKNNGVTFSGGYSDAFGNKGEGVSNLVVFHQKVCGLCNKSEVKKITLKGRGTFYCPRCQK